VRRTPKSHDQRTDTHPFLRQRPLAGLEDRPDLEQADVAFHARQVVLRASSECVEHGTAEVRLVLSERIRQAHESGVRAADEGHRSRFVKPGADECIADAANGADQRRVPRRPWTIRAKLVGEGVVATQARDLLDEVHFTLDIPAPGRNSHAQICPIGFLDLESDRLEK
jgi:hypothetical protein